MKDKIPWHNMMRYSHFKLGIPPKDFWNLSMIEFLELSKSQEPQDTTITKQELQELIERFK